MTNDNWTNVINQLEPNDWETILGPSYDVMRLLTGGNSICDWASTSFTKAFSPYEILEDKKKRDLIISKVSSKDIQKLATELGLDPKGPNIYSQIKELEFKKNHLFERTLLDFFDISRPAHDMPVMRPADISASPKYGLYDYQRQIITDVKSIFDTGSRRLIIQMPTGSGKTRTAMYLISKEMCLQSPFTALWLAYSRELCEQASLEFEKAWASHGNREVHIINAYEKDFTIPQTPVDGLIIITIQKLSSLCKKEDYSLNSFFRTVNWLIFDEAHQAVAPRYQQVISRIVNSDSERIRFVGLTATPGRTWNIPEEDKKLSNFFHNIVKIKVDSHWNSPNEMLTAKGFLSKIEWIDCEIAGDFSLNEKELNLICDLRGKDKVEEDLPPSVIRKLSVDTKRNVRIVEQVDALLNEGKKRILVFCASVDNARVLCTCLVQIVQKYGGEVSEVDGTTDAGTRDKILELFKQKDDIPRVICNFNLLTTGFDAPNTDAGVIARPTLSLVLFSQMVGRVIRGPKVGGTENATIVSVVDTKLPGFRDSYNNWKDVWND